MTAATQRLRGLTWEHERGYDSLVAAARQWAERSGTEVVFEARSLQAFADAPLAEVIEGYDLVVLDHPHVPLAAEAGLLLALDGCGHDDELAELARHSVGLSHASYQHAGHQWALANDAAAQVAAWRPDLLDRPPRSWPEVLELAAAGRVLWPGKPIDAFSSLLTLACGAGASPPTGPALFLDHAVARKSLHTLHQLTSAIPEVCLGRNPIEIAERLVGDDRYAYAPLLFGYSNYCREGYRRRRLRYTDIPAGPSGPRGSLLGGAGIAVCRRSAAGAAAVDFAFWVAGREAQCGVYFDGGGQPGHALAWTDDRLNAVTDGFFRSTRATLEGAWMRPRDVGFVAFQDEVAPLVTDCLRGGRSDDALLDALDDATRRHLASAGAAECPAPFRGVH